MSLDGHLAKFIRADAAEGDRSSIVDHELPADHAAQIRHAAPCDGHPVHSFHQDLQQVDVLFEVGLLKGISHCYVNEISSGMRRRVEIARAMMNDLKVLLLDEPYRAMDALTKSVMHKHLLDVYDRARKTVFFITHDIEEAIYLGGKVAVMTTRPGRIKKVIDVDIPRPRDFRVLSSERYRELKLEVLDAVQEEAQKAFEAGEREMA